MSNPAPLAVYQSQRTEKSLTYAIPSLTPYAAYTVRLHFAETYWTAAGRRVFGIAINGTQVLSGFDVFASAGGANIALTKQFSATANAAGKITVVLTATVDNASIAGIEIIGGTGSSTPAPTPAPTAAPFLTGADALPWVYAELWSGSSPFRITVAQQKSRGATVVSHSSMDALWSQGIAGNGTAQGIPIYTAKSSDPLRTTVCLYYGGRCNASGAQIHLPSYAVAQQAADGHIVVVDQSAPNGPIEIDCWQASVSGSQLRCSWAGLYHLGGAGTSENGSEGIHGGMAYTTVAITGQELANGHIDHALGMAAHCLNNPTLFPSDTSDGTDASCGGSSPPHYGNLMHLLWSASQIASSSYSAPCKVVLTAMATYGAFLNDTGNNGMQLDTQNALSYTANSAAGASNPWPRIQSEINSAGDGSPSGSSAWRSCLNRLSSSNFEMLEIPQP